MWGSRVVRATRSSNVRHASVLSNPRSRNSRLAIPALPPLSTVSKRSESSEPEVPQSFFDKWMGPQTVDADPSFTNRWLMVVPAFSTHMCIGSPWAWSALSGTVSRELGFVSSAAGDWSFAQATMPLSIVFMLQGISAAAAGAWQVKMGARVSMTVAGCCFGGGLILGSIGIATHSLPLLYFGYGFLGGCGVGIAYTPPVQALIQWFPDRTGLASGMTIAGFGGGALLFAPATNYLCQKFAKMPQYVGSVDAVQTTIKDGSMFTEYNGVMTEVVLANGGDLAKLPYPSLMEGYYVVGSGNTGAASALGCLGVLYLTTMVTSAFAIRRPAAGYVPEGYTPPVTEAGSAATVGNVHFDTVLKTPQFWLLGTTFFCVATGGMGLFSVAKPMMNEVFSSTLPTIVTASFCTTFLMIMSSGNLGGRLAWAWVSDQIGRRNVFYIFSFGSIPLYLSIPYLTNQVVTTGSQLPLTFFCMSSFAAISCMGGVYAILPAYEADLFGSKYVGPIHGRFLMASTCAAMAGPALLLWLRSSSEMSALRDLLSKVDPTKFEKVFGVDVSNANILIESNQLSISKLMDIMPAGTTDPAPFIYDSTMYSMAGLMAVAAVSHMLVKPVDPKFFEQVSK